LAYLTYNIEGYAGCDLLNSLPRPQVRVLCMIERVYYLDRPFIYAFNGSWAPFFRGLQGREDFVRRARELGITHVIYEPSDTHPAWLSDPETFFSGEPFRELARW